MRNLKSIAGSVAFMVLWAGAAIAMPTTFFSDEPESSVAQLLPEGDLQAVEGDPELEGETEEVTVPDEGDQDGDDQERPDNHGAAVSTAAHCDLKGPAKGVLVSSVARDPNATVESAQAACDAALAEAEAAGDTKGGKPDKASRPAKAPRPEKVDKAPAPKAPTSSDSGAVAPDDASSGPSENAGPPSDKGAKKP